ncbi:hypothetical protein [Halomarina rubra]|uniref:Lipoprotein n=1 Tax=Halomarina rubra TaxID=2071873 RepID=A0ABD6B0U3_9EURY|nr:hypothetical protein [Halomarina rubra]
MPSTRPSGLLVLALCSVLVVTGCLGTTPLGDDEQNRTPTDREVDLEYDGEYFEGPDITAYEEAAAVEYRNDSVVVTGLIPGIGDRPCLTMDADATRRADGTLAVQVTSDSEVPADKGGCNGSLGYYDYRATVVTDARPDRVVVTHDSGFRHTSSLTSDADLLAFGGDEFDYNGSEWAELVAVERDDGRVLVTGQVEASSDDRCLTMNASTTRHNDGTLVVTVTSGVTHPENDTICESALALREFRAAVGTDDPPTRVVVALDGRQFAATRTYDGTVLNEGDGLYETPAPVTTSASESSSSVRASE